MTNEMCYTYVVVITPYLLVFTINLRLKALTSILTRQISIFRSPLARHTFLCATTMRSSNFLHGHLNALQKKPLFRPPLVLLVLRC